MDLKQGSARKRGNSRDAIVAALKKREGKEKKRVQVKQVRGKATVPRLFFLFRLNSRSAYSHVGWGKCRNWDVGILPTALILPLYPGDNRRPARRRLELREGKEGGR